MRERCYNCDRKDTNNNFKLVIQNINETLETEVVPQADKFVRTQAFLINPRIVTIEEKAYLKPKLKIHCYILTIYYSCYMNIATVTDLRNLPLSFIVRKNICAVIFYFIFNFDSYGLKQGSFYKQQALWTNPQRSPHPTFRNSVFLTNAV